MAKCGLIIGLVYLVCVANAGVRKTFRPDYTYSKHTDAFYKLHMEKKDGRSASEVCQSEGSKLMVSVQLEDMIQILRIMNQHPELGDFVYIASDGLTPSADDECDNTRCLVQTIDGEVQTTSCRKQYPFVCKVGASDAHYGNTCRVNGTGYQLVPSVRSCYKIPSELLNWDNAEAYCEGEGSHLAIINSELEKQEILKLIASADVKFNAIYVGVRAERLPNRKQGVFKTVFNQTLDEAGFNEWQPNEPNNLEGSEYCGNISKDTGKLNDMYCWHVHRFICEKEI